MFFTPAPLFTEKKAEVKPSVSCHISLQIMLPFYSIYTGCTVAYWMKYAFCSLLYIKYGALSFNVSDCYERKGAIMLFCLMLLIWIALNKGLFILIPQIFVSCVF